jgi:small subunit ribosomal protein S1
MTGDPPRILSEKGGDPTDAVLGITGKKSEPIVVPLFAEDKGYSEEDYRKFSDLYSRTLKDIDEGQIVTGRVLAISNQEVVVDIGFKSEGTIPLEEFGMPPDVKVGDKVDVFLDSMEDADGQLILSKRKADFMRTWDRVIDIHNEGSTIKGRCARRIKGGIVVDLMGVDAFLPGSQIDVKPVRDFDALIGQTFDFKIVKVNKLRKNIVVSRRAILEESMAEKRKEILEELQKGQVREGMVKNITDFGVFVDLGGVDGLLHINDLSWGRINHPSEVVKLDEKIKVVVLDFNDVKDRISLGMKQLQAHPWENIEQKFPMGSVVKGKVVSIADYGAFVELEKGVEGLIHVSEMSWTRSVVHPSKIFNVGDVIDVKILSLEKERKRISLGVKQLTPDPWDQIEVKYPIGSHVKGRVRNLTNFGAFVEMEDGIDGLIHISDLSWTKKVKHPSEVLKKSQDVEVVVLEVNKSERRLSLGYKQLIEDPWAAFEESYKVDTVTSARISKFMEKGMVVELPLGLEGFVPLSQLPENSMAKVQQSLKEGDEIQLIVIEFDKDNKRVVLSRKKIADLEKKKQDQAEKTDVEAYLDKNEPAPTLAEMTGAVEAGAVKTGEVEDVKAETEKVEKKSTGKKEKKGEEKAEKSSEGKKKASRKKDVSEETASTDSGEDKPKEPNPEESKSTEPKSEESKTEGEATE